MWICMFFLPSEQHQVVRKLQPKDDCIASQEINKQKGLRPITHDLAKNILIATGCNITKIVITELVSNQGLVIAGAGAPSTTHQFQEQTRLYSLGFSQLLGLYPCHAHMLWF